MKLLPFLLVTSFAMFGYKARTSSALADSSQKPTSSLSSIRTIAASPDFLKIARPCKEHETEFQNENSKKLAAIAG